MNLGLMLYLINVIYCIGLFLGIIGFLLLFSVGVMIAIGYLEEVLDKFKKSIKICFITSIVSLTICCFIPDKETSYQILIASQINKENIEKGTETIKSTVDYIFEKIEEVKK